MGLDLLVERRVLSAFTCELVNCKEWGPLVYRVIHRVDPTRDRQRVVRDLAVLDPELKALIGRCTACPSGAYAPDESVLDGVSYEIRLNGRVLALFCPELSTDSSVVALGRCLDAFFRKLESA